MTFDEYCEKKNLDVFEKQEFDEYLAEQLKLDEEEPVPAMEEEEFDKHYSEWSGDEDEDEDDEEDF